MATTVNEERRLKHLFDGTEWNVYDLNVLNLGVGAPATDVLENCCDIFQKATTHRLQYEKQQNCSMLFQYGPVSGIYEARAAIAKCFTQKYGSEVKSEDLIITSGATQGLHILLSTLIDLNGYVFVDEVTYMVALTVLKQFSTLHVIPVKLNDDGVDLADFAQQLKQKRFQSNTKEFWAMYYTIPVHHNPTGIVFSTAICQGLVKLARQHDFLIVCDDIYLTLTYSKQPVPARLFSYDVVQDPDYRGNVISNGSFSKILGPGARVGWLEVPARLKHLLVNSGFFRSGGCLNNYTSGILASMFELNLAQPHMQAMFDAYEERMLASIDVLTKLLPANCKMIPPRGGYFIWIRLPAELHAEEFLRYCMVKEKIYFIPSTVFAPSPENLRNCLRLSISFQSKDRLVDGMTRFCAALERYMKGDADI